MRTTIRNLFMLSLLAGLVSCGDDVLISPSEPVLSESGSGSYISEITVTMPEIQSNEDFADTRVTYDFSTGRHPWTVGDTLGIFPSVGGQVEFAIDENTAGGTSASFDGGGWALKVIKSYAAYFPYSKRNVYTTNKTIPMDYTGQVQTGNESTAHLASYDYLASGSIFSSSDGKLNFPLTRLGSFLRIRFNVPASDTYTSIELYSSSTPFVTKAELDVSRTNLSVKKKDYSNVIRLELKDVTLTKDSRLTAWMMAYPVALASGGGTLRVVLHGKKGDYEADLAPQDLTANNPFAFTATLTDAYLKNENLIAAAENSSHKVFERDTDNNRVSVNNPYNREIMESLTYINVEDKNDPTVLDEINYFPNLEYLYCKGNNLATLDVSRLKSLLYLDCKNNKLTTLNLSANKALQFLFCENNKLTSLDVSDAKFLVVLNCSKNSIKSLDVSLNRFLEVLYCSSCSLSSLDVTNNAALTGLDCSLNNLGTLDLSNNTALKAVMCNNNKLTTLDISNNVALTGLNCNQNQLNSLNVSKNVNLTTLTCLGNSLKTLNLENNTELTDLNCSMNYLTALDITNNKKIKVLSCSDNLIKTLTIPGSDLEYLYCRNNELVEFSLNIVGKLIRSIDFSGCKKLKKLSIADIAEYYSTYYATQFSSLNVDGCTALEELTCHGTAITKLDITTCTALKELHCYFNRLNNGLDVSKNTQLTLLECFHNNMSSLDITACPNLNLNNVFCGNRSTQCTLWVTESQNDSGFLINTPCYLQNVEYGNVNDNVTVQVKN
ncbi:MAG: hypothetical protein IJ845_09165 [Bacteroidaceae bacterium]|nr:hypothetical protein [Bacteroidaceae bacterium]